MENEKIVIIVTHGMGKQDKKPKISLRYKTIFDKAAKRFENRVRKKFEKEGGDNEKLVFAPVNWAKEAQEIQTELKGRLMKRSKRQVCEGDKIKARLCWKPLRGFMVDMLADAIVYQQTPNSRSIYDKIHNKFKDELKEQADKVGENAKLCILAHSLGTVIINNFLFDLQSCIDDNEDNPEICADTPLEQGKTLQSIYTMGSPLALWAIRHNPPKFGKPIVVDTWINFYNKNDVMAYPLGNLNKEYNERRCNAEKGKKPMLLDQQVCAGNILTKWNPISHNGYWTNRKMIRIIVKDLLKL